MVVENGQKAKTESFWKTHISSGNNWTQIVEENLSPRRTRFHIQSHWINLSKKVAVYVYSKNIDGVHKIFNEKTKRFLLIRDDIKQCLIALRTQLVSKEILDAVKVTMLKNTDTVVNKPTMSQSNAKKRPPSSELGNPMQSNPSNDDTAHQKLCVFCPRKKVRTVSIDHDSIDTHHALLSSSRTAATTATRTATATATATATGEHKIPISIL